MSHRLKMKNDLIEHDMRGYNNFLGEGKIVKTTMVGMKTKKDTWSGMWSKYVFATSTDKL